MDLTIKSENLKKGKKFDDLVSEFRSRETTSWHRSSHLVRDTSHPGETFEISLAFRSQGYNAGQQIGLEKGNDHFFSKQQQKARP